MSIQTKQGDSISGILDTENESSISLSIDTGHGEITIKTFNKKDIESQSEIISGMPPMGLILSPRELRDVMAYVQDLK